MASEGLNKVQLIGNLGMDPELKFTQSGRALLRIRLATTERYGRQDGERQERTEWHTVIVWGNRAEALSKFLRKGRTIYVEGRIQTRSWETDAGERRYSTEIIAQQLLLLGGGRGGESDQGGDHGGGTHREERHGGGYSG
ncbi:MAG: single-stranded DNA-binding protein, partial [Myxococcales bacterium]|nr:single-stranded DNA-binding protein [Myxococcales bacterium]